MILDFSSTCQVDSVVWLLSFLFRLAKLYKIKRGHVRRHRLLRLPVVGLFFFFFTLVLPLSLFSFSLSLVLSVCECVCVTLNGSTGTSSLGALLSARMRFQISCPPLQPGPASFLFFSIQPHPLHTPRDRGKRTNKTDRVSSNSSSFFLSKYFFWVLFFFFTFSFQSIFKSYQSQNLVF